MDHEHVPVRPVEPGQDQELVADPDALQRIEYVGLEVDPGVGRTLVSLLRSGFRVRQRRGDAADLAEVEGQRYGRVSQSISGWA
jgi:hypothetical protein